MFAKADRIINPDLERMYAKRANSHTVEIAGASHSVYESRPKLTHERPTASSTR
jgi:pimeloyl-ACP methyl ester carboxylesterase